VKYSTKNQLPIKNDLNQFRIESMGNEDLEEVLNIENSSFPTPWTRRLFEEELHNPNSRIFLLKKPKGEKYIINGYICLWLIRNEVHILKIAVHPFFRRKGFARKLLQFALDYSFRRNIDKAILEVREHNYPARFLYEKFGFYQIGIRAKYYEDTKEDALIMELNLKDFFRTQQSLKEKI
jgi:ribosomal-protein-alanine N-acetyltransferase